MESFAKYASKRGLSLAARDARTRCIVLKVSKSCFVFLHFLPVLVFLDCQMKDWLDHKKLCRSAASVAVVDACQVCNKVFIAAFMYLFDRTSHRLSANCSLAVFARLAISAPPNAKELIGR